MSRLVVRYRGPDAPLSWLSEDPAGRILHGPHAGPTLPASVAQGARTVIALVPGDACGLGEAKVAARSRDQLARAIPFALEESLAEPVEALHFAWFSREGGQVVGWIRRDRLASYVADLRQRGVVADSIVAEQAALPIEAGVATVLVEPDDAIVRVDEGRAFTVSRDELSPFLARVPEPRDGEGRFLANVFDATGRGDIPLLNHGERRIEHGHALSLFARGLRRNEFPDFATGAFATKHRGVGALKWWRTAAALAATLAVLALALVATEWLVLRNRLDALNAEMTNVYRSAFPDAKRIVNPRAQLEGELRLAGGAAQSSGAMPLLAKIAPMLTRGTTYTLSGIEYRNDMLEIAVRAPGVAALDQLRESVAATPGLRVELANATSTPTGAEGRLRIAETGT